ncbi:MAG TPA: chitobiase/beta-hexosaminidase C-terminal domain-containing protein, partial [Opitutaceae bacterium]|nr:chitobiase/beta-hexosaminidase C-terminal domain-containing protein [Opitutaceae bacterium]
MKALPLTCRALTVGALMTLPAFATTMTSLSDFEGEEEPTVIYFPASNTFKNDSSFINITNISPGVVQMLLRYNSTWWDGDGAVSTRTDRQRAEVKGLGPHQKVGQLFEYVTTWRTSPNFPASPHWEDFFQLKATDGDNSLPLVFGDVRGGPANAHVMWLPAGAGSHIVARNIPSAAATWQALTWRIKTSPRGSSTGLVQASVNGDSFQGPTNVDVSLANSTDYRPKWGLYRGMSTGLALGTDNGADYIQHSNVCVNLVTSTTAAAPDFNPGGGIYSGAVSAVITSATPGATIRYTTDGSTPSASSGTIYTGPVPVGSTTTIHAIASANGMTDSGVNIVTYVINGSSVAAPSFSPAPGTYSSAQSVTISDATSGASIRYTTDGSTPSETAGTLYTGTPV